MLSASDWQEPPTRRRSFPGILGRSPKTRVVLAGTVPLPSAALPPPLHRNNRPPLPPAPPAPEPRFEVEYPILSSASGVSSATWWQAARGRLESLLADQLVMADLGTAGFKVVGDLVIIMCDATKQRL